MKQAGFTLIELILVLIIIMTIAVSTQSSFTHLIEKSRASSDTSRLLLILQTTRQYSINNSSTAVLCPTLDQIECMRNWNLPLMLFLDKNKNKKRDNNETIEGQFTSFLKSKALINYPKAQIRFNETGMANYYNGTLSYCLDQSIVGIIISRLGRIRFAQDLNGDHIPDVNSSTSVSCE